MIDTTTVAGWIAHIAFWVLLIVGWVSGELERRGLIICLLLWGVGYIGADAVGLPTLFTTLLAVCDIALVFIVIGPDVRTS